ncbi:MAG: 3-deoxy-8-phosphooctulonate synthase [Candidatus Firestonebacteria bacterium]
MKKVELKEIIKGKNFILIAGPCVIESLSQSIEVAKEAKKIADELGIFYIFKSSYDKGNRTAVENYRGPGLKNGLKILEKVKEKVNVPILTDVQCKTDVDAASKVADVIQIPAYLCQQTELTLKVAETGKVVNIKKGQFLSPLDVKKIVNKVKTTGNNKIIITERGTIFGYNDLIVDMRSFSIMKEFGYPIIFDVTHAIRIPGFTSTDKKGGQREFIFPLAMAGIAAGSNGLFVETHPEPSKALCDASSMLPLKELKRLLIKAKKIYDVIK